MLTCDQYHMNRIEPPGCHLDYAALEISIQRIYDDM